MTKRPRYLVRALWLVGQRYEAQGWVEVRTRGPKVEGWESRCAVVRWNDPDFNSSMPISVRLELAGGGELSGTAYVDRSFQLWGDEADLKIHGTPQRFNLRASGPADYVVAKREVLKQMSLLPFRVVVFVLVAVVTIIVVSFLLLLIVAPEIFLRARPGF